MSYFGRIAGRASSGEGPSTLAQPAVRSASPLVEFDQRLHLTSDTGEPAFDMAPAPIHGASAGETLEGPAVDAAASVATAGRGPSSFEPQAGPRLRAFGARQRALHHDFSSDAASDEHRAHLDVTRPARLSVETSEPGVVFVDVLPSNQMASRELGAAAAVLPLQTQPLHPISHTEVGEPLTSTPPGPADLALDARAKADASIESTPFTPKVRPIAEPARLEPAARSSATNPSSALGEALAKVSAWMKRPTLIAPSAAASTDTTERMSAETFATPSMPKLVIGQIDIEVIAPKEPPRPAARRQRAPQAAAARTAYSSLAKQSFGSRQR